MKKHMLIKKLKLIIFTCLFSLLILSNSIITFADAEVVPVTLPTFNVTMNGEKIDNDYNKYPFINSIYPITEKNMSVEYFKFREENIYFINQGNLYSFTVGEDIVKTVNGVDNVPVDSFEILDENIYYVNGDDLKIYMIGITESLNSGETAEEIVLLGDYVMLKFNSTVPNSYRTMIYDRAGNQVFKSTAHMNVIHNYSDIIVYYDDIMSKVFTIRLK